MRMRLGAGAGGHPHQPHNHAVALDAGAVGGRIVWPAAQDVIHLGEVEHVLAVAGAGSTGRARDRGLLRHRRLLHFPPRAIPAPQADARTDAWWSACSNARARPPRMAACSAAAIDAPRTCATPSVIPMSKG